MSTEKISLAQGSGGRFMHDLIKSLLLKKLNNPILRELSDSAKIEYKEKLAFTTDSFVVAPLFFCGGDIGKLAVCGSVNDLVVSGARPEYLSLAFIVEEGLDYRILEKVTNSIAKSARKSGVVVATGDFKVVEKGACDKMFINTSAIGRVLEKSALSLKNIEIGDRVILSGNIAQHGLAVLAKRKGLDLGFKIRSDCASLDGLLLPVLRKFGQKIKFMRDPTRGGVATTLNEIVQGLGMGIIIEEKDLPLAQKTKAACELLGINPLYIANEGIAIMIVKKDAAPGMISLLRKHPLGKNAKIAGSLVKAPRATVVMRTILGTERIIEMLSSEPLPRIC